MEEAIFSRARGLARLKRSEEKSSRKFREKFKEANFRKEGGRVAEENDRIVEQAELSKEVDFSSAQGSYETRRKGGRFASDTG